MADDAGPGAGPALGRTDALAANAAAIDELGGLMLMGRRNLDTVAAVNRLTVDCILRCADQQVQAWSAACQGACDRVVHAGSLAASPADGAVAHSFGTVVESSLAHLRALSEIIARTNQEALTLIQDRSAACLSEVEGAARRCLDAAIHPVAVEGAGAATASGGNKAKARNAPAA